MLKRGGGVILREGEKGEKGVEECIKWKERENESRCNERKGKGAEGNGGEKREVDIMWLEMRGMEKEGK